MAKRIVEKTKQKKTYKNKKKIRTVKGNNNYFKIKG